MAWLLSGPYLNMNPLMNEYLNLAGELPIACHLPCACVCARTCVPLFIPLICVRRWNQFCRAALLGFSGHVVLESFSRLLCTVIRSAGVAHENSICVAL